MGKGCHGKRMKKTKKKQIYNSIDTKENRKMMRKFDPDDIGNANRFLHLFKDKVLYGNL